MTEKIASPETLARWLWFERTTHISPGGWDGVFYNPFDDTLLCPGCIPGNCNKAQLRIVRKDGTFTWMERPVVNVEKTVVTTNPLCGLVVEDAVEASKADDVDCIEYYDTVEQFVLGTCRDGIWTWEPCPVCGGTTRIPNETPIPEHTLEEAKRSIAGIIYPDELAKIMGLQEYWDWYNTKLDWYNLGQQIDAVFLRKLGDPQDRGSIMRLSSSGGHTTVHYYTCPECKGVYDPLGPLCDYCHSTECWVTWDKLILDFEKEREEAQDEVEAPYYEAWQDAVLRTAQSVLPEWGLTVEPTKDGPWHIVPDKVVTWLAVERAFFAHEGELIPAVYADLQGPPKDKMLFLLASNRFFAHQRGMAKARFNYHIAAIMNERYL